MKCLWCFSLGWQFVGMEASHLEIVFPQDFEITAPLLDDTDSLPASVTCSLSGHFQCLLLIPDVLKFHSKVP